MNSKIFNNQNYKNVFIIISTIIVIYLLFIICNFFYHLYTMNKTISIKTPEVQIIYNDYDLLYKNIENNMNKITIENENVKWGSIKNVKESDKDILNYYNTLVINIRNCYEWSKNNNQFMKYKETLKIRYDDIHDLRQYSNSNLSCWSAMVNANDSIDASIKRLSIPIQFLEIIRDYNSQFSLNSDHYYMLKENYSFGIKDRSLYHEISNAIYTDFYNLLYNDYMTLRTVSSLSDFLYDEIESYELD